jgi:hypothetical protein
MTDVSISKSSFNMMRAAIVVLVLITLFLLSKQILPDKPDPIDIAKIIVHKKPLQISKDFQSALEAKDIISIALFNKDGQLSAFSVDGASRDLCHGLGKTGSDFKTCEFEYSVQGLTYELSEIEGIEDCGGCKDAWNNNRACHKTGSYAGYYRCPDPHTKPHGACVNYSCSP